MCNSQMGELTIRSWELESYGENLTHLHPSLELQHWYKLQDQLGFQNQEEAEQ